MRYREKTRKTYEFSSDEERDAFLDKYFPNRESDISPGCYTIPDDSDTTLCVFINAVTVDSSVIVED